VTTNSRKQRGRESEKWYAEYVRARGWPNAEAVPASLPGRDTTGMPGLAPEVKSRYGFDPVAALRQAKKNANGDLAYVVCRMNGQGKESIGQWVVCLENDDFIELLRAAGYGDPLLF